VPQAFLKSIGSADDPLNNDWIAHGWRGLPNRTDLLDRIRFARNKRPTGVQRDDKLVLYASGWERFFGVAIVVSPEPYDDPAEGEERWPWVLEVRVPLVVPRLELAPRISEINVAPTSVRQQSHIHMSDDQYRLALDALARPVR